MIRYAEAHRAALCSAVLFTALFTAAGCGDSSVPTKIHEGGGTIPEIVDQPEPSEVKKSPAPKK